MRQRGSSVLEAVAAMGLGALLATTAISQSRTALSVLGGARTTSDALTVARNLIEHELGSPCDAGDPGRRCPAQLACSLDVTRLITAPDPTKPVLRRVVATVAARSASEPVTLTVIAAGDTAGCS